MENIGSKYDRILNLLWRQDPTLVFRYKQANTLEERVAALYCVLNCHSKDILKVDENDAKSSEHSKAYRAEGNAEFTKSNRNLVNALLCYTNSIAAAPYPASETDDSVDLALAFANRSAVLLSMGKHDECLSDITQTLQFQYPYALKYKVYMRKGECLQIMGRAKEARQSFEKSKKFLPLATDLTKDDKRNRLKQIRTRLLEISTGCAASSAYKPRRRRPPPQLAGGINVKVPAASSCIEIAKNQEWGRYIRATRDIKPGEVLMIDTPYVSVMLPHRYYEVCCNCLDAWDALIPCKTCRVVMFCSKECRKQFCEEIHDIECAVYFRLIKTMNPDPADALPPNAPRSITNIGSTRTAFRLLMKACKRYSGLAGLFKHVQEMAAKRADGRIAGFNDEGKYESHDFETAHNLQTGSEKRDPEHVCSSAFDAAVIVKLLETCGPYQREMADATLKRFAGGLLLQYMMIVLTNGFEQQSPVFSMTDALTPVGNVIFPTVSLLNHSCFDNAFVYTYKTRAVLMSLLTIKKGDQVFINYTGLDSLDAASFQTRRSLIEINYLFTCCCKLCSLGLPNEKLENSIMYWQCPKCHAKIEVTDNARKYVCCQRCKRKHLTTNLIVAKEKRVCAFSKLAIAMLDNKDNTAELSKVLVELEGKPNTTIELLNAYKAILEMNATRIGQFYVAE